MKSHSTKILFIPLLAPVFVAFMAGFAWGTIEDNLTKSFTVGSGGKLTLKTDIGSMDIKGVEGNTLEVEVTRRVKTISEKKAKQILEDLDIEFQQSGNDVIIKAEYKRGGWSRFWDKIGRHLQVKYNVTVPRIYNLELKTKGGSISVNDLEGEINCHTSGGSLHFDHISGPILGRTSGGSIHIGEVNGNVDIHTSGGSIKIANAQGEVDAHTSGGSITVKEVMGSIRAQTSGGSVKAYISRQPQADCRLTTSGGSITVYLEEDIGVYVDASTSGGHLHTDFPVTIKGKINRKALKAKINGGGPELYLHTSGGSIYIKKK